MKKRLLIAISLVTASLIFSACGGSSSSSQESLLAPTDNTTSQENDETTPQEETENPVEEEPSTQEPITSTSNLSLAKEEPYFKYAWHINSANSVLNNNAYTIHPHADINLTKAWELTMGAGVKVAVIDNGVEVEHEDLKANIFLAYNADDGSSNVKTDGDEASHGNNCAGLILAPINGKGIVGIAPESKLIAIKQNEESDAKTIRAFEYAKNQGAKVISCSWGTENVSEIIVAELKSLYDAGVTVLFASGNEGASLDREEINDESEVEWVIGIGASTELNDVGSYSNYGTNLDLIAPGGDTWESTGILSIDDMGEHGSNNNLELVNNNYAFIDGTSFSAPVAAGVVALMYAANPQITPAQVRDILISTATKVGIDNDASYNDNGFDEKRAYGKINAGRAVTEAKRLK
jgi:subtilisin family serine protease